MTRSLDRQPKPSERKKPETTAARVPRELREVLAAPGHPVDPALRRELESRLGHDFSRVRVHTDTDAATVAELVGAEAVTVGQDIFFAKGRYRPETVEGRHLLTHELLHTIQTPHPLGDLAAGRDPGAVSTPGQPAEREAESLAEAPGEVREKSQLGRFTPELRETVLARLENRLPSSEYRRVLELLAEVDQSAAAPEVETGAVPEPVVETPEPQPELEPEPEPEPEPEQEPRPEDPKPEEPEKEEPEEEDAEQEDTAKEDEQPQVEQPAPAQEAVPQPAAQLPAASAPPAGATPAPIAPRAEPQQPRPSRNASKPPRPAPTAPWPATACSTAKSPRNRKNPSASNRTPSPKWTLRTPSRRRNQSSPS